MPKRCYRVRRTEKRNPLLRTKKVGNRTEWSSVKSILVTSWFYPARCDEKIILSCQVLKLLWAAAAARCFSKPPLFMPFFSISHLQISVIDGLKLGNWIFKKSSKPGQASFFNSSNTAYHRKFCSNYLKKNKATFESPLTVCLEDLLDCKTSSDLHHLESEIEWK